MSSQWNIFIPSSLSDRTNWSMPMVLSFSQITSKQQLGPNLFLKKWRQCWMNHHRFFPPNLFNHMTRVHNFQCRKKFEFNWNCRFWYGCTFFFISSIERHCAEWLNFQFVYLFVPFANWHEQNIDLIMHYSFENIYYN